MAAFSVLIRIAAKLLVGWRYVLPSGLRRRSGGVRWPPFDLRTPGLWRRLRPSLRIGGGHAPPSRRDGWGMTSSESARWFFKRGAFAKVAMNAVDDTSIR